VEHGGDLITTIALGLSAAFVGGFVARRLRLPPIVGYLLAGVALGPFTPGLFADPEIATELAEIGVILLMFGVGIHFSFRDLLAVRGIAIPGAIVQISAATVLGIGLAVLLGWGVPAGVVLGLSLSVASTVVLLRALMQRNALDSVHGRAAVGWLIVEDIFTVLVLVLLPSFALLVSGEAPVAGPSSCRSARRSSRRRRSVSSWSWSGRGSCRGSCSRSPARDRRRCSPSRSWPRPWASPSPRAPSSE
jgi:monovalent cation:H+ antiporter-2, CPA2 family